MTTPEKIWTRKELIEALTQSMKTAGVSKVEISLPALPGDIRRSPVHLSVEYEAHRNRECSMFNLPAQAHVIASTLTPAAEDAKFYRLELILDERDVLQVVENCRYV